MGDSSDTGAAGATPKKARGGGKPKKPKTAPSHPKVSEMVNAAITSLKERGGSSVQAIKKYIAAHYKVDVERLSPFIKKYLKSAVASGALVQTKGKGATGSFRLRATGSTKEHAAPKAKKAKKEAAPKKAKPAAKKVAKPKKAAEKKKPKKASTPKKAKPAKSQKKSVKAAKPKAAKPKKAKATPKKAPAKKGKKK